MLAAANQVTISLTGLVNILRFIDIVLAIAALISLIPFSGLRRLHPLIYPAILLLLIYNSVNLFTEIGRWNTELTWRLPLNLLAAAGSLWFGVACNRIEQGNKTKIPFIKRWVVPYTGQSIVTDAHQHVVYEPADKTGHTTET
jgi:hypothetical protein